MNTASDNRVLQLGNERQDDTLDWSDLDDITASIKACALEIEKSTIDYSNLDDVTAGIKDCASELEKLPSGSAGSDSGCSLQSASTASSQGSSCFCHELPTESLKQNDTSDTQQDHICYFKTKTGGYKAYELSIGDNAINFRRPKSTKQQALSYDLDAVQSKFANHKAHSKVRLLV